MPRPRSAAQKVRFGYLEHMKGHCSMATFSMLNLFSDCSYIACYFFAQCGLVFLDFGTMACHSECCRM